MKMNINENLVALSNTGIYLCKAKWQTPKLILKACTISFNELKINL